MNSGRISIALVVSTGLIITSVLYCYFHIWEKKVLDSEIERRVDTHLLNLQSKINLNVELLESIASIFQATNTLNRKEFRDFVTPILDRYSEVKGYSWNPLVKDIERNEFEATTGEEGFAGFQITEFDSNRTKIRAKQRDEYVTVFYLEPLKGNEQALGYDISSEAIRHEALTEARESKQPVTTKWIRLVQEKENQYGVLIVRPIFSQQVHNNTAQANKDVLKGYLVGVFRIADMIQQALKPSTPAGLDFWVFEGAEPNFPTMSYFHPSRSRVDQVNQSRFEITDRAPLGQYKHQTLRLPGKQWSIFYKPAPALLQSGSHYEAIGVLASGLLLTIGLGIYLYSTRRKSQLAEALNAELQQNILDREGVESALRESESYNRMLFEKSTIGLVLSDFDGNLKVINPAFASILGRTVDETIRLNYWKMTASKDEEKERAKLLSLQPYEQYGPYEKEYRHKNGSLVTVRQTGRVILRGNKKYIWSSVEDITEYKKARERIVHMAFHDALTNLPNRALLLDRLAHSLDLASRNETAVGVLFFDIDRFKTINDSLGHRVGDQLLIQVAIRLQNAMRKSDTIARFGGDEFIVVAEGITEQSQLEELAKSIIKYFAEPFKIGGHTLFATTSIGIAISSPTNSDGEELIMQADIAMYSAKDAGRNTYQFHLDEMGHSVTEKATMERDLHGVLTRNELLVYLQPIESLKHCDKRGFEALMRWHHPKRGLVNPGSFIPVMEDSGMIVEVSRWMLEKSCQYLREISQQTSDRVTIGVNFSAPCFYDPSIVGYIKQTLNNNGLAPESLVLEITESTLFKNPQRVRPTMEKIKEIGVLIALDDFGTGQSSLNHLRNFPIDIVKIDREFIQKVPDDSNDCELVSAIIAMAHSLNMKVVAEGVETEAQLNYLKTLNCDSVQGYYFSKPFAAEKAFEYLHNAKAVSVI